MTTKYFMPAPEAAFAARITEGYQQAFATAQGMVKDADGAVAEVKFSHTPAYPPFRLDEASPVVAVAARAVKSLGLDPVFLFSNGGLDANWLDKHGIPTVTIGAGQYEVHTISEYVDLKEFATGCRLAVTLATIA